MTSTPPAGGPSEDGRHGSFGFEPAGPSAIGDEDPVIRVVTLRSDEHAGPFWDEEGHVSDDYDELRRWIGISRTLFDDCMAWNAKYAATGAAPNARREAARRELVRRLRSEVHPLIDVQ